MCAKYLTACRVPAARTSSCLRAHLSRLHHIAIYRPKPLGKWFFPVPEPPRTSHLEPGTISSQGEFKPVDPEHTILAFPELYIPADRWGLIVLFTLMVLSAIHIVGSLQMIHCCKIQLHNRSIQALISLISHISTGVCIYRHGIPKDIVLTPLRTN